MKKKILSILLVITLILSLSACGAKPQTGDDNSSQASSDVLDTNNGDSNNGVLDNSGDSESAQDNNEAGGTEDKNTQADGSDSKDDTEDDKSNSDAGDANQDDSGKNDSNKNDSNKNDSNKNDSNKNESNTDNSETNNNQKPSDSGSNNNDANNDGNNGSGSGSNNNNTGSITTSYIDSFSAKENELADAVIAKIITSGMGEFEKVKAIHDYLVMNVDYDYQNYLNDTIPMDSHKAIGALKNKIAVCDGYSYAFQLLCLKAGVSCELVTGVATESGTNKQIGHAWNQVKIDGKWYNMDVTWDDPATVNGEILGFNDHSGCSYEYFCIPDNIIYKDHVADNAKHTCTSSSLFERALKAGVPWDDAKYVASETELINLLKAEAQKNNANPSFYIKGSTIKGDTAVFFSKCMSKAGIDFSNGYSWAYFTYFEGTTDPGTYYQFTLNLVTNGTVTIHPVVSTMAELKAELLKAYQAGQSSVYLYYDTSAIAWDNGNANCYDIIYTESGYRTGIDRYWQTESSDIPQLSRFAFY